MLNRISAFIANRITNLRSWKMPRQYNAASGFCCIYLSATELLFIHATLSNHKLTLQACEKVFLPKSGNITPILSTIVEKYQLKNAPCLWMLDPKDYQLFPMEALPVEADEFQSAIRWKLKGNISFELEDAVIDKFFVPVQKSVNAQKMMTVVAARQSYLQKITAQIQASGLNINIIDIPELGLRNLVASFETDDKATALIYLSQQSGQLIITRKQELYLSRRIDFNVELFKTSVEEEQRLSEKLALELQRSFDYFHTQWRSQVPERVFLIAPTADTGNIAVTLSQFLGSSVTELPINELITNRSGIDLSQMPEFIPLIGGLLREENAYATAN